MSDVRTRIAPSPTGFFHIGTARSALINYLFAKKHGGSFVLRIEDTDLERSEKRFEENIFESIQWLGIIPDEWPVSGGLYGPYRDSERVASAKVALEKLFEINKAFYCFHPQSELAASGGNAEGKIFQAHVCEHRDIPLADAEARIGAGERGIIRFRNDEKDPIVFRDLVRGELTFDAKLLGDFSLAKDLDTPLYNFAVVVDDSEMEISHVIRGEDHIANTPKQILIQRALGYPEPVWAHLPLILGSDRSKLSKRHGATSVKEFQDAGYLPEALINYFAFLGWNPGTDQEIFSLGELVQAFDFSHVQKSGAIWSAEKLDWMNGEYIRNLSIDRLKTISRSFLPPGAEEHPKLEDILRLEQPRLKKLSELEERTSFFFREPEYDVSLLRWKSMTDEDLITSLKKSETLISALADGEFTVDTLTRKFLDEIGVGDKGAILWPLRVALSGKKASPGPFEIMTVLGKIETEKRIQMALSKIG